MPSLTRFLRSAQPQNLMQHATRIGLDCGEADDQSALADWVLSACSPAQREQLVADMEKIMAMTDEIGQAAMLQLPDWRDQLLAIEGAQARAHWLFLQSSDAFRHAEEIRYVDEHQNSRRMWAGFVVPTGLEVDIRETQLQSIEAAVRGAFGARRFHIEPIERLQSQDPDGHPNIQLTIYSEDFPVDELEFMDDGLRSRSRRPVRETAIVYDAVSGTIEVISKRQDLRRTFAALFAQHCLGVELSGEQLPFLVFDLMPLIDPHPFPTNPEDGIAKVKLTMLTLSPSDQRLIQQFQVKFDDPATLHELIRDQYGDTNPLDGDLYPWRASIEVQFEPSNGSRRRKKIRVDLTKPNRCSLRGKTERERLILDRYLRDWGVRLSDAA
ncbi:hypothetical protein [Nitrobacter sp. Nb-311A]|uniref:hypothetical protein n=1 Tax=Nitrobacter sp. Nb-311A TaxID=314253 RepID=UPI0003259746|nr:hypothetical protein [Nitrobacter sp. Nb-311A]